VGDALDAEKEIKHVNLICKSLGVTQAPKHGLVLIYRHRVKSKQVENGWRRPRRYTIAHINVVNDG
jgi:hypothetical protein